MKSIMAVLFIVAVLSLSGKGIAISDAHGLKEPVYPPYCWVQPPGSDLWYECNSDGAKLAECANLMELAMKGVDPFVQDPLKDTTKEEETKIKKIWERAKNSCWSDLKDLQPQHYH